MAISAVVAVGDAGDALVAKLKHKAEDTKVGPGRDKSSEMGPGVTPEARDRIVGSWPWRTGAPRWSWTAAA